MKITFYKYEGAGNDFIIIDNRAPQPPKGGVKAPSGVWGKDKLLNPNNPKLWAKLCDRRFGIGADGLMLLQNTKGYDFEMYYVNADGKPTSMCGNGGRCITHFAKSLGVFKGNKTSFIAIDGPHEATIKGSTVKLKMKDVNKIEEKKDYCVLNTGSPHYVKFVKDALKTDVYSEGKSIRNSPQFKKEGINVNFIQSNGKLPLLRTYERGVENETLACGTGTVASALVLASKGKSTAKDHCDIKTMGGNLRVWFNQNGKKFTDVYLEGPATFVYKGEIEV